jgi:NAD(P)-dependent dehydrogenase (short-subunit alcohol dehydrogenase family)
MDIKGETAIVTGAAAGIGKACAQRLTIRGPSTRRLP